MASVKLEIHGADNIQRHISIMLRRAEEQLGASCKPFTAEMLFAMLEGANYICLDLVKPKEEAGFSLTVPVLEALRWFTVALDCLLRLSDGIIKAPRVESFKAIMEGLIPIVYAIGEVQYWRSVQEVHRVEPMKSVVAEGNKLLDPEEPEFYAALTEMMSRLGADLDWSGYFRKQILRPRLDKWQLLHSQAFRQYYELEASDFATLEAYFEGVAQSHSQRVASLGVPALASNRPDIGVSQGFPQAMNVVFGILQGAIPVKESPRFTPLALREQVLADLHSEMGGEREKSQKWLKALEYHPGKDIFRHPIIPLIENGRQIYTLLPWIFYPAHRCGEQWDGELFFMLPKPQNKWAKAIGQWYGDGFRDYVVEMLRAMGIVDLIERGISRAKFGDQLTPWLRKLPKVHKDEFRPDIIFQKGDMALIISCKAEDLYFDYWLLHNYLFLPASKIRETIERDMAALREVSVWGECIASMDSIRHWLGIHEKKILPILVTARKEPLGSPALRKYLAHRETIPRVPAVTAGELRQFIASGFDLSLFPIPHPPELFTVDDCAHH